MHKFYHRTSTALPIKSRILPPIYTQKLREDWRKKDIDKVFFTTSLLSAFGFAKKACEKYGGEPIVYKVRPVGQWYNTMDLEYIADEAIITGIITDRKD